MDLQQQLIAPGTPVQVVNLVDNGRNNGSRHLKLNTFVLKDILLKAEKLPIAVIAIAGPARSGKSFVLSYIVRYLQALEKSEDGNPGDWMDHGFPELSMKGKGFEFKNSDDRTTDGIWMWSRPFIIRTGGSPFAMLLMDTEGCFDKLSSDRELSSIIGLSLLLSSCFIFNDSSRINELTMATLAKFIQHGKIASQSFDGKAFQRLMFLIRDWSMKNKFDYGAAGGQGFLLKEFTDEMSQEAKENRQLIVKNFEHYNAYLMPHPGHKVLLADYNGCVADMSTDFQFHIENFVANLVSDVVPKKIASKSADRWVFEEIFRKFVDAFNEEGIPSPASIHNATVFVTLESQLRYYAEEYQHEFHLKFSESSAPFFLEEKLKKYHKRIRQSILLKFAAKRNPGSPEQKEVFAQKLESKLEALFRDICEENSRKQQEYVAVAEAACLEKFQNYVQREVMGPEKIWYQSQFNAVVSKGEVEFLQEFLEITKDAPKDFLKEQYEQFQQKIARAKLEFWNPLRLETAQAENVVSSIIEDVVANYASLMESVIPDDEAISEKALTKAHTKQLKTAEKSFMKDLSAKFTDQSFIQRCQCQFQQAVENQMESYRSQNQLRLNELTTLLDNDISEMIEFFNEQSAPLKNNMSDPNFESELNQLVSEIQEAAVLTLEEEREIPDVQMQRLYIKKIKAALGEEKNKILQSKDILKEQKEKIVEVHIQEFNTSVSQLMSGKAVLAALDLEESLNSISQDIHSKCKIAVEESCCNMEEVIPQLEKLILTTRASIVAQNSTNMQALESKMTRKIDKWKQDYYNEMKVNEKSWNSPEEAFICHQKVNSRILQRLKDEDVMKNNTAGITRYERILQQELNEVFEGMISNLESKIDQREELEHVMIPTVLESFRSEIQEFVDKNPFVDSSELIREMNQRSLAVQHQVQDRVSELALPDSSEIFKSFMNKLTEVMESTEEDSSNTKVKFQRLINELITSCVAYAEEHPSYKAMLKDVSPSEETKVEVMKAVERHFNHEWVLSSGDESEKKAEAWSEVELRLNEKFHNYFEERLKKSEEEQKIVEMITGEILENFRADEASVLNSGRFYYQHSLESLLSTGKMDAKSAFVEKISEKDIPVTSHLDHFEAKIDERIFELRQKNEDNREAAIAGAMGICDEFFLNRKSWCRNEEDLEKVKEEAVLKCRQYLLKQSIHESEEEAMENQLTTYCQEAFDTVVKSLDSEIDEDEKKDVLNKAVKFYKDSMDKLVGVEAVNPKNLHEFHNFSFKYTINRIKKTISFITKTLDSALKKRLNESFTIYTDRNNLLGAQGSNTAIGIDLGTTTSCVAIYKNGSATVIKDSLGQSLTPSYVFFDPSTGRSLVGNEAKNQAHTYPEYTVFDAKRLIGRKFSDPKIQEDMKTWPFSVRADRTDRPKILVAGKQYDPEDISAHVLSHMKELAEKHLGETVFNAVITTPANFTDRQRDATKQAAQIAGLKVLQMINEPTAAAMAHSLHWDDEDKIVLVFDLGGGTFDVSILRTDFSNDKPATASASLGGITREAPTSSTKRMRVLATHGDMHLGGEDFDHNMVIFCSEKYKAQYGNPLVEDTDGKSNAEKQVINRRLRRMRNVCEEAKVNLTSVESVNVSLDAICDGNDLNVKITRMEFEQMNEHLFKKAIKIVEQAIDDAGIHKRDITEVLMVGGSSRILRVKTMLQEFLEWPTLNINQRVDIQEAVALGAAVQACILNGGQSVHDLPMIEDVQPFSLGIEVKSGALAVIIKRNTTIPREATEMFYTTEEDQKVVRITIFAGEDEDCARNNSLLGEFMLEGIPPGSAGAQQIAVRMMVDSSGILNVTATATSTGGRHGLVIQDCRGRLTEEEILERRANMN